MSLIVSAPPEPYPLILDRWDLSVAVPVGAKRKAFHILAHYLGAFDPNMPRNDLDADPWDTVISACTEYGVAKVLGKFWPGDYWTRKKTVDIPPDIEVRYTRHENGHLLFYDNDDPAHKYVLVTGKIPAFMIHGWFPGADGLKPETIKELKPGWSPHAVPIRQLRPFKELL